MKYDHIIIGGGLYGCATAKHLADAGRRVLILEADTITAGASGGFGKRGVRANRRDIRELPLARQAHAIWPELSETLGQDTGFERTGGIFLFENETTGSHGGLVAAESQAAVQNAFGITTETLSAAGVKELLPGVSNAVKGGIYVSDDGMADHSATTAAYAAAAQNRGAVVQEQSRVSKIHTDGADVVGVETETQEYFHVGESILLSNNFRAVQIIAEAFAVDLPIWPLFPQALLLRPKSTSPVNLLIGHDHRPLALKTLPDGMVMASGGWRGRWNSERTKGELVEENVTGNLAQAQAVFPDLNGATLVDSDASRPESCSADQIPIIDIVPKTSNAFVATGWTGHGFAIAPAVAPMLASWMTTMTRPDPLAPFTSRRFNLS